MSMLASEQAALHFPVQAEMPEGRRHFQLRTLLFQFLQLAFGSVATVGSDQFVYWDPTEPRACLAPDAFVRFGVPDAPFDTWKVWERGAPQVAVEVISKSDAETWHEKLAKYKRLGVAELVWFDPAAPERPIRIWDFVGDDLLERHLPERWARSIHLSGYWHAVDDPELGLTLRLSLDEQGTHLLPTPAERHAEGRRAEAEGRRAEAEGRRAEAEARSVAEARVRELEAELRRRSI